jgi:hypothetical protein
VLQHQLAHLQRQIANRNEVFVSLGREADHVVQLQVLDAAREDQLGAVEDLVVRHGLVDDAAQAIGPVSGAIVIVRSPLSRSSARSARSDRRGAATPG